MPGGSVRLISSILASTAAATVRLFSPISISAVPTHRPRCPFSLALPVRSLAADRDLGDVPDADRHAVARRDHDLADLREVSTRPVGAHDVAFAVALDVARAAADVVGLDRALRCRRRTGRSAISLAGSGCT